MKDEDIDVTAPPVPPPRPTSDELTEHAERIADMIGAELSQALTIGLASRWDAGLLPDELAHMQLRIARSLHDRLDAMLKARGFDATGDTKKA